MEERPLPKIHVMPRGHETPIPPTRFPRRMWLIGGIALGFILVVGGATWYFTAPLRTVAPGAPEPIAEVPAAPVEPVSVEPTTPVAPPEETITPPVATAPLPSDDADNDGLTNAEEQVLGTTGNNPDTDNDGFLDGHEAINLYNPGGFQPERLVDAGLVREYTNTPQRFSFYYPSPWSAVTSDDTGKTITISGATGETMVVAVLDNPQGLRANAWYQEQNGNTESQVQTLFTKAGLAGIVAPDGRSGFFAHDKTIVAFRYNVPADALSTALLYPHLFEMLMISLVFSPS